MNSITLVSEIEQKLKAIAEWHERWQQTQLIFSRAELERREIEIDSDLEAKLTKASEMQANLSLAREALGRRLTLIQKIDVLVGNADPTTLADAKSALQNLDNSVHDYRPLSEDISKYLDSTKVFIWERTIQNIGAKYQTNPSMWERELKVLLSERGLPDASKSLLEREIARAREETTRSTTTPAELFRRDFYYLRQTKGSTDETFAAGLAAYALNQKDEKLKADVVYYQQAIRALLPPDLLQGESTLDDQRGRWFQYILFGFGAICLLLIGGIGGAFLSDIIGIPPDGDPSIALETRTATPTITVVTSTPMASPTQPETVVIASPTSTAQATATATEEPTPPEEPTQIPTPSVTPSPSPSLIESLVQELRPEVDIVGTAIVSVAGITSSEPLLSFLDSKLINGENAYLNTTHQTETILLPDRTTDEPAYLAQTFLQVARLCAVNGDLDALILVEPLDESTLEVCNQADSPLAIIPFAQYTSPNGEESQIFQIIAPQSFFRDKPELLAYLLGWYTLSDEEVPDGFEKLPQNEQIVALEEITSHRDTSFVEITTKECNNPSLEASPASDAIFQPEGPFTTSQPLTLRWILKNNGDCNWASDSYVILTGNVVRPQFLIENPGQKFPVKGTGIGQETLFMVYLPAPQLPNIYDATFTLYTVVNGIDIEVGTFTALGIRVD